MYKLIIFDLDGTLLDTLPDIYTVLNGSLSKFGLPEITLEQTKKFVGNGAEKLVKRAVGDSVLFEEVYADYSVQFPECGNANTKLFEGEKEVLKELRNCGVNFAVITNKPQRAAERVMAKFFGDIGFDFIIGQSDKHPLKPDPTSALAIIKSTGLNKSECLFVGDGETDVQTARGAGIDCVSVLWGYRSREELEKVGAKHFANDWRELEKFAKKLL